MFQFIQNYSGFFVLGIFFLILIYGIVSYIKKRKNIIKYDDGKITIPLFGLGHSIFLSFRINLNTSKLKIENGILEYALGSAVEIINLNQIELIDIGKFPGGSFLIYPNKKMNGFFKYKIICWLANKKLLPEIFEIFKENGVQLSERAKNLCEKGKK